MKSVLTSALVLAALSGTAFAGDAQLAALAGVDAASYSNAELAQIIDARQDNDSGALRFLLSHENRVTIGTEVTAGSAQLAQIAGVEPGEYTPAELSLILQARQDGDSEALGYYLSHKNRVAIGTEVTPGSAQLAQIAGVEPGEYTPAELSLILRAQQDGDSEALSYYLSHTNRNDIGSTVKVARGNAQLAGLDAATVTAQSPSD